MRTALVRAVVTASALTLVSAACGDDSPASPAQASVGSPITIPDSTGAAGVGVVPTTLRLTDATADIPLPTSPAGGSSDIPVNLPPPPDTSDAPLVISVTVGVDADPNRIENVPIGATVSISILNPDADDEFHLHGYDLGDGAIIAKGQTATLTFTATLAGQFELESHTTNAVLLVLNVG